MLLEIAPKARENFHILRPMIGVKYQQFAAAARRKIFRKPPNLPEITKIPPVRKSSKYAKGGGIFVRLSTESRFLSGRLLTESISNWRIQISRS